MSAPTIKHAPAHDPFPAPLTTTRDPLTPLGLRLDYRTACAPWGSHDGDGNLRLYTVAIDPEGGPEWSRVTCKRCLR